MVFILFKRKIFVLSVALSFIKINLVVPDRYLLQLLFSEGYSGIKYQ